MEKRINDPLKGNHKRLAFLLILIGFIFGIDVYTKLPIVANFWPFLVLSLGIGFIGIFFKSYKRRAFFLFIGVYVLLLSLLFFFYNFAGWDKNSIFWPFYICFIGLSFLANFFFAKMNKSYLFAALFFIFLSILFFLVFTISTTLWWLIFIFLGISIYITGIL